MLWFFNYLHNLLNVDRVIHLVLFWLSISILVLIGVAALSMGPESNSLEPNKNDVEPMFATNVECFINTCPLLTKRHHFCSERRLSVSGRNELDNVILLEALVKYRRDRKRETRQKVTCTSLFTNIVKLM